MEKEANVDSVEIEIISLGIPPENQPILTSKTF
jgi:hypothetical protein